MITMKIKLYQDSAGALHGEFLDGLNSVSQNNVASNVVQVIPEGFDLSGTDEVLQIAYATSLNENDPETETVGFTTMEVNLEDGTWSILVEPIVCARRGTWYLDFRTVTQESGVIRTICNLSKKLQFSVNATIYDTSGNYPKAGDIVSLYNTAINSVQSAEESAKSIAASAETITQNAKDIAELQTLPLEKGEGTDSVVQRYTGEVDDTHYGNTNTGDSAAVFGEANSNTANRSIVSGKMNKNDGANSLLTGYKVTNSAVDAIVGGNNNTNNNPNSIVFGSDNVNNGACSLLVGYNNINSRTNAIVGGYWNAENKKALLAIGNGKSETERSNAFEAYVDGRAKVQSAPVEDEDVVRLKELKEAISTINQMSFERVEALPEVGETTKIYLVNADGAAPNVYEEWIYTAGTWEKIGTTDIDLSGYAKKGEVVDLTSEQSITGYKMFADGLNIGYVFDFTELGLTHNVNSSKLKIPTEFFKEGYEETIATQEYVQENSFKILDYQINFYGNNAVEYKKGDIVCDATDEPMRPAMLYQALVDIPAESTYINDTTAWKPLVNLDGVYNNITSDIAQGAVMAYWANYDGVGNEIHSYYASRSDLGEQIAFLEAGIVTVGKAKADQNGDYIDETYVKKDELLGGEFAVPLAEFAHDADTSNYASSAYEAAVAEMDGANNVIVDTYATKEELNDCGKMYVHTVTFISSDGINIGILRFLSPSAYPLNLVDLTYSGTFKNRVIGFQFISVGQVVVDTPNVESIGVNNLTECAICCYKPQLDTALSQIIYEGVTYLFDFATPSEYTITEL